MKINEMVIHCSMSFSSSQTFDEDSEINFKSESDIIFSDIRIIKECSDVDFLIAGNKRSFEKRMGLFIDLPEKVVWRIGTRYKHRNNCEFGELVGFVSNEKTNFDVFINGEHNYLSDASFTGELFTRLASEIYKNQEKEIMISIDCASCIRKPDPKIDIILYIDNTEIDRISMIFDTWGVDGW